jgi:hypothetical protein
MVSALFLALALACAPDVAAPGAGDVDAPAAAPAGWAQRFELVRADLAQLEAAHTGKDKDTAIAIWEQAYRQRFEPLIELPAGERVDHQAVVATEYAFGRLRDAIESPREPPVRAALEQLRQALDTLEPLVGDLPAPEL